MLNEVEGIKDEIIGIRRQLHMYPEVRFELDRTCALVKDRLEEYGIEYSEDYGKSSIVGFINRGKGGKVIALRADMDALDLKEENDISYRSRIDGRMHGCGHDGHTAMLLGAAKILYRNKDKLNGEVKLIFQASEEGPDSGAKYMVRDGVLEDVDRVFALHINTMLDLGIVHTVYDRFMAAGDSFSIEVIGNGGHAGLPHEATDAIQMANSIYNEIQKIRTRAIDPRESVVVTIGTFNGGLANNVIAEKVVLTGTIRTFLEDNAHVIYEQIESIVRNITSIYGGTYNLNIKKGLPPLINNREMAAFSIGVCKDVVGCENVMVGGKPFMGSEDFAFFTEEKPGSMVLIGGRNDNKGLNYVMHNPRFDFDEDALVIGSKVLIRHVTKYFETD